MNYKYVTLENEYMRLAYKLAKNLYMVRYWNKKTTPVAIIVKDGMYISHGVCADGRHAIEGTCNRLEEKGTSYDTCRNCKEEEHAEQKALIDAKDVNLRGAVLYVYGHYHICDVCAKALNVRGIDTCYLLENATELFDRHHANTVLGTSRQFLV